MKKMNSTSAKNNFGEILTTSQREPVVIEKNGKPVGVLISYEEFKEYQESVVSDRYWGKLAEQSGKMVGKKKSEEFFESFGE